MPGMPHAAPHGAAALGRHVDTHHLFGGLAAKGRSDLGSAPVPACWRSCCRLGQVDGARLGVRHATTSAARRGRAAIDETSKDPPPVNPAADSAGDGAASPGGGSVSQVQQQQQQQQPSHRRRKFGPEPPPPLPMAGSARPADVSPSPPAAAATGGAGVAPTAAKRRGRPPKQKPDPVSIERQQPSESSSSSEVPLAEATAAVAAAAAAAASSSGSGGARKAFGPEPPPASPPLPFSLPDDPSQLNIDDILSLPLPDPRVSEPFRLSGDFSDLGALAQQLGEQLGDDADFGAAAAAAAEAAGASFGADDADGGDGDEADLDYDQLIALASRVDAARYVARAFERAKQGLEPVPEPSLEDAPDAEAGPPAAAATPPQDAARYRRAAAPAGPPSPYPGRAAPPSDAAATTSAAATATAAATAAAAASGYSPPPRPRGDSVYVDEAEDVDDEFADDEGGDDAEQQQEGELSAAEEAAAERRVGLLVDLLSASGGELEAKLEAAAPEVDEQLLSLLERRYTSALALRQDAASAERVATLYRALRYMYERRTSSAAERLLDDVLGILADEQLQPNLTRRRGEAAARLRNAFTGGMLDVDVFTAAAALAEGRQAAAEALAGEQVPLEAFKAEAMELLGHAERVQAQTVASLETIEAEVARLREAEPAVLEGREWRGRLEQVRLARVALGEREESMGALQEVLLLTRAVELQMLTGRMEGEGGGGAAAAGPQL